MNTKSAMCITLVALVSPTALIAQEQAAEQEPQHPVRVSP